MKQLFTTEGRIPRITFWKFFGCMYAFFFLAGLVLEKFPPPEVIQVVIGLCFLPVLLIAIIVQIKRWHDRDKSGWWVLINFIPYLGALWSLIECGCLKGTPGPNRFGPDPVTMVPPPLPSNF